MISSSKLEKYICTAKLTVREAMERIDLNTKGILYVTDEEGHLMGSLTDGDIRRWILKGGDLAEKIGNMLFRDTKYLFEGDADKAARLMKEHRINSVPIVSRSLMIIDIIFSNEDALVIKPERNILGGIPVIVMAGGKGTRLYPYTRILPKPLIPIGDVPILERIMNRFYEFGVSKFFLIVNYKKEIIKSYLKEQDLPYNIIFIDEPVPLGTAGGIRLIEERLHNPVIVTNCDILIETEYDKIIDYHNSTGNDMTIVSSLKNTLIPYGVLHSKECGIITSLDEKPRLSYFINTGMYVVNPKYFQWIPEGEVFHMTELTEMMMKNGGQVGMYPISENSFLDMGEFEEMKKMETRINRGYVE